MISQVTANPKSTTSNQYGFYAIPKTIKPKAKYRQNQYEQQQKASKSGDTILIPINDQQEDEVERDFFVNQAPYPEFMPKQAGLDKDTQIEDEELFDFTLEVEPLLEILVGQAVLKARNELQEQHEQVDAQGKLRQFQKKRQAELMVTQRLEAHNRRRNEQNQRRLLQHQIYGKQKKLVLKKLHAVNQSKRALINLKSDVLNELEGEGFLRYNIFIRFRSQFLPWLYEQIDRELVNKATMTSAGEQILNQNEDDLVKKHKENMQKETARRRQILDQREQQRLAEQDRKRKKAIRKERLALNKARKDKQDKVYEAIGKMEKSEKITKNELSDGRAKGRTVSYVSGGALGYLSEILSVIAGDGGPTLSEEKLEALLVKLLKQFQSPIDLNLPVELKQIIEGFQNEAKADPIASNEKIDNLIDQLVQNHQNIVASYINFLLNSPRNLKQIIKILLKIHLTQPLPLQKLKTQQLPSQQQSQSLPLPLPQQPKQQLTQLQKTRLSIKPNLRLTFQSLPQHLHPSQIIRIRYSHKQVSQQSQSQEQYIQIFDGQGWNRNVSHYPEILPFELPIGFNFQGFESSLIFDEISNNLYGGYLIALLNSIGVTVEKGRGVELVKRLSDEHAEGLREKYGSRETPIYDVEIDP